MEKLKEFWEKLKSIRHFEIYLAVFIGVIICVVYFGLYFDHGSDKKEDNSTEEIGTAVEYVDNLENKLCNVLSKIDGVMEVDVMITLESGFSYEYVPESQKIEITLDDTDEKLNIVKEIYPKIKGVVVVAKGSEDFRVKMDILEAVVTLLQIDESAVTILS